MKTLLLKQQTCDRQSMCATMNVFIH